ncbi:hypothetical protein EDD15DRAFT_2380332 [Pisolithus albus]|nr:hypothetical protein EDD15DRAFT_2380332 [Pisolithus albus]
MCYSDIPTHTASDRSNSPTSLLDSSTSSAPSTPEQVHPEDFADLHILDNSPFVDTDPPSFDHCLAIIRALQLPFVDSRVFNNVTPEEFVEIVSMSSDYRRYQTPAELLHSPEACQVVEMAPYPIHEAPRIQSFAGRIRYFLDNNSLGTDDAPHGHHPVLNFNLAIEDDESPTTIIPDLRLDLRPQFLSPLPIWVMECGFSSKLPHICRHHPRVGRRVDDFYPRAFMPTPPHRYSFRPVVVEDVNWISVALVTFQISLRERDGRIQFGEGPLCAQGQLYPDLDMHKVDELLDLAAQRLLLRAADLEAEAGAAPDRVAHLRHLSTTATFPSDWTLLLDELQAAVWQTAFSRYRSWRHSGLKRRRECKGVVSPDSELRSSRKRMAPSE